MDGGVVSGQLNWGFKLVTAGGTGYGDDPVGQLFVHNQLASIQEFRTAHVTAKIQKR